MNPNFELDKAPLRQAREGMTAMETVIPNRLIVHSEVEHLLTSATKANRALIAADTAQNLLAYHAGKLEEQLEAILHSGHSASLPSEDRQRLRHALEQTQARLQRTESYARGCRDFYLSHIEQQIHQLEELDEDRLVVHFR